MQMLMVQNSKNSNRKFIHFIYALEITFDKTVYVLERQMVARKANRH